MVGLQQEMGPGLGPVARNGSVAYGHSRRRRRRSFRSPSSCSTAPRCDRQYGRHDDRMVRFLAVWPNGGAGLREIVFSVVRPIDRHVAGIRRLRGGLCRAADRCCDLWALRRPHRPQGGADRDVAADRLVDLPCRMCSDLPADRHLGAGPDDRAALHPGNRCRRRMGRLGPAVDGMGAHQQKTAGLSRRGRNSAGRPVFLANLAILAFSQMSGEQFYAWGWRVPFWLSLVMVIIGLWIRLGILETPIFQKIVE